MKIIGYQSIGDFVLGKTRDELHQDMGPPEDSFMKNENDKMPTDVFCDGSVQVAYQPPAPGRVEFIEVYPPNDPLLDGHHLMERPFREVLTLVKAIDPDVEVDETGLISKKLGISIYAPGQHKDPDTEVEAVAVFRKGLYESYGL